MGTGEVSGGLTTRVRQQRGLQADVLRGRLLMRSERCGAACTQGESNIGSKREKYGALTILEPGCGRRGHEVSEHLLVALQ